MLPSALALVLSFLFHHLLSPPHRPAILSVRVIISHCVATSPFTCVRFHYSSCLLIKIPLPHDLRVLQYR